MTSRQLAFIAALCASSASAFTASVKVISIDGGKLVFQTTKGTKYQAEFGISGCELDTRNEMKGQTALFYNPNQIGVVDPFEFNFSISDQPALFILGSDSIDGRCQLRRSKRIRNDTQGCCSHHGGILECSYSVVCEDGWISRSCTCEFGVPVPKTKDEWP